MTTALDDFSKKYHAIRAMGLIAAAASAAAQGDHELAAFYAAEAQRTVDVLRPEHLRVVDSEA